MKLLTFVQKYSAIAEIQGNKRDGIREKDELNVFIGKMTNCFMMLPKLDREI